MSHQVKNIYPRPGDPMPMITDIESAPVPSGEELLHSEWYGTADVPEPIFPPIASYFVVLASDAAVTLPAAEAALLTRIAEVAASYAQTHNHDNQSELFRLANEWRIEWKHKPRT